MTAILIDRLYGEFISIIKVLEEKGELSLMVTTQDNFRKTMLLSSASYFEFKITNDLITFFETHSKDKLLGAEFIKNKAIKRQYHTFFNWDAHNANQFFGLFGSQFKKFMDFEIDNDPKLSESIDAFIQLGGSRNLLIHENYLGFQLEPTAADIYGSYEKAKYFVDIFPEKLKKFIETP
jgi:hypothetical protein